MIDHQPKPEQLISLCLGWIRPACRLVATVIVSMAVVSCGPSVVPPTVSVIDGHLVSAGLLDQRLQLVLCVTNPNAYAINLARVTFAFSMAGATLARGVSETPLDLPPAGSVPIPFAVSTTFRDISAPLAVLLGHGTVDYTVSGTVLLRDFTLIGIPYSVTGQINPIAMVGQLISLQPSGPAVPQCVGAALPPRIG